MAAPQHHRPSAASPPSPKERRLPPEAGALRRGWRWLKGLFRRPIGLVGEPGRKRLGFVERRKRPSDALSLAGLRAELRQRMLTLAPERVETSFSHLVQVHDELGRQGWAGVARLPHSVLLHAMVQANELRRETPSPAIKQLVDKLFSLLPPPPPAGAQAASAAAAEAREPRRPPGTSLEVSEASHEDFEASRRSWFGDLPPPAPATSEAPPAHK